MLAEGGPGIAAQLAGAGFPEELCLTVSSLLAGGDAKGILDGGLLQPPARLELQHVLESDGYLFLRYRRPAAMTRTVHSDPRSRITQRAWREEA